MSDTSTRSDQAHAGQQPGRSPAGDDALAGLPGRRKRRGLRITLISLGSVFALIAVAAVAGVVAFNHLASQIRREPVHFAKLTAAGHRAAAAAAGTENVVITGTNSAGNSAVSSGLIMILHVNANHQAGGVVSIPPQAQVPVPGHGQMPIQQALAVGGPSLLISAVEHETGVSVNHWAQIDFSHVANVVNAEGGVDVTLPAATSSDGYYFHAGTNHLDGGAALAYARQASLSEEGRVLAQQSLIRAVLSQIAGQHLLSDPTGTYNVLSAATSMLTVDSNFTNGEIASLASELKGLASSAGTFVTAPVNTSGGVVLPDSHICDQLWDAINNGALASFAKKYPSTVTPTEVP